MENLSRFKELAAQHNTEIVLEKTKDCDWFFYEEDGACGYPLQISTPNESDLVPSEHIYSAIEESVCALAEAIMDPVINKVYFNSEELLRSCFDELEGELEV